MQEIAISWGIWAYIMVWWLELLLALIVGPLTLIGFLRLLVVTIATVIITLALFRHRWLWPG